MCYVYLDDRVYLKDQRGKVVGGVTFYSGANGTVTITHTFVAPALRGQGVASRLLETVVSGLRARQQKVRPLCAFAQKWFARNLEFTDCRAVSAQ